MRPRQDMTAGRLTERVTIQSSTPTPDNQGGSTTIPVDLAEVWASVTSGEGSEGIQAAAIRATLGFQVVIRYRPDVRPTMRLIWRPYRSTTDRTLEIHSVSDPTGERTWLTMICAEVV